MRRSIATAALAAAAALGTLAMPPASPARADDAPATVDVRFVGGDAAGNLGLVLSQLAQAGRLELRAVPMTERSPTAQLFKGLPFVGNSASIDAFLCGLNPQSCTMGETGDARFRAQAAPADAVTTDCRGKDTPPDLLCLPALSLRFYDTSIKVPFNGTTEDLAAKVQVLGACPALNDACVTKIARFNPGASYESIRRGRIIGDIRFPITGYKLKVTARTGEGLDRLYDSVTQSVQAAVGPEASSHVYVTAPELVAVPRATAVPADPATRLELARGLKASVALLQAMNYHWRDGDGGPRLPPLSPVVVGVWDKPIDTDHCAFSAASGDGIIALSDLAAVLGRPAEVRRQPCGTVRAASLDDHGTHTAGIVGLNDPDHNSIGANPKARIWAWELTANHLEDDDDPISRVVTKSGLRPLVINISMTSDDPRYTHQMTALLKGVRNAGTAGKPGPGSGTGWADDKVFVAAAGNDGLEVGDGAECGIVPACWSAQYQGRGIISVIGLDRSGQALMECPASRQGEPPGRTNYGEAFDVAAVGFGFSALNGDAFGEMCGTSVAAPYVSALVSMLEAKAPANKVVAKAIRTRVLATADMIPALVGKVRYGKVNFERALRFEDDLLVRVGDRCDQRDCALGRPSLVRKAGLTGMLHVPGSTENGRERLPFDVTLSDVRRITRVGEGPDRFRIVFDEGGVTKVVRNVAFPPLAYLSVRQVPRTAGGFERVRLSAIQDLTLCSIACRQ